MDQIICGACRTLLMYASGASSVRCLRCYTVNLTTIQVATIHCRSCHMALMYPSGASSVKCVVCHFITNVGAANDIPYGASNLSTSMPHSNCQTVVIENPTSFDQSGRPVNNIVVGVTTKQK